MSAIEINNSAINRIQKMNPILLMAALVFISVPLPTFANSKSEYQELFNMSLDELLEVKVSVASRLPQSLINLPANVTLISQRQLREWNVSSLWELMGRVPGVIPLLDRDQKVIGARGLVSGNTRGVLVLINGHPLYDYNEIAGRGIESQTLDMDLIEQVEVLRGPGGLVWNGNPLIAVINLKMKKASEQGNEANVFMGSQGTRGMSLMTGLKGEQWHWNMNASVYRSDGTRIVSQTSINPSNDRLRLLESFDNINPPFGRVLQQLDQFEPSYSLWMEGEVDNFRVQAFFMHFLGTSRQLEIGQGRRLMEELNRGFISANYHWLLGEERELNASFSYSKHDMDWYRHATSEPTIDNLWRSQQRNYGLNYQAPWAGGHILLAFDYIDGDLGPVKLFNPGDPNDVTSVSNESLLPPILLQNHVLGVQYQKTLSEGLVVVVGFKWSNSNQGDIKRENTDPQIALIWSPSAMRTFKLTYNQAALRPDAGQVRQGLDQNTPDQKVGSLDLIWYEQFAERWTSALTIYQQSLKDRLLQREVNGIKGYGSIGDVRSSGLEYEISGQWNGFDVWGNLTYTHAEYLGGAPIGTNPDTLRFDPDDRALAYPDWMANFGVTLKYSDFTIAPSVRYIGSVTNRILSAADDPDGIARYRGLPSNLQLDVNINYQLSPQSSMSFYINNFFNQDEPVATTVFNGTTEVYGRFLRLEYHYNF